MYVTVFVYCIYKDLRSTQKITKNVSYQHDIAFNDGFEINLLFRFLNTELCLIMPYFKGYNCVRKIHVERVTSDFILRSVSLRHLECIGIINKLVDQ